MIFDHDYVAYPELTNSQLSNFGFSSPHPQITEDFFASVVKVHDGDTVTLSVGFRDFNFPLRLLDIDALELSEGGDAAQSWLENKILGKEVFVLVDRYNRVGKYGRLLGKILVNGMSVASEMLHLGLVDVFGKKKEGEVPNANRLFNLEQWF